MHMAATEAGKTPHWGQHPCPHTTLLAKPIRWQSPSQKEMETWQEVERRGKHGGVEQGQGMGAEPCLS